MNLTLHHFRKDVRQFRVLLAVWFGLLLLNLAVNLGWVAQVTYRSSSGFDQGADTWAGLLPGVIWILIGLLPSLVVLTDSPARREGFLATRPLPRRDLFAAKFLFVLLLIVAPWITQEMLHLAVRGAPGWVIIQGTAERLMFTLPVALGFGAYAAFWSSHARWARALASTFIGGYLSLGITVLVWTEVLHKRDLFFENTNVAQAVAGLYAATIMLAVLVVWHSRAYRSVMARWGALLLVALAYGVTSAFWPWNPFALQPENPATAKSVMAATDFKVSLRMLSLQKVQDENDAKARFNMALTPKVEPQSAGTLIEWNGTRAVLARAGGAIIQGRNSRSHQIFSGNYWNNNYDTRDFLAWSGEFPDDILFHKDNMFGNGQGSSATFDAFDLPANPQDLSVPVTVQASFDARVFAWHKIADLPLRPGATSTDEFGSWKLVAFKTPRNGFTQLFLERRQIELATAVNSRCSGTEYGPHARMAFMVYDPQDHIAWLPDQMPAANATRGGETALSYSYLVMSFYTPNSLPPAVLSRGRLIIFEKSWVGSVPESWQSPSFTLDEKLIPASSGNNVNQNPMPRSEFNQRVAALKAPAPDAPRHEASLYLLDFLNLVEAQRFPLLDNDPQTRLLATYVPAHLDLLLDGLPVMEDASRNTVLNAIKLGATEAQKPQIIAALPREPDLAGVLFARGWVDDARPEIFQLAQSSRRLPLDALRAIVWLHDPDTYPRLIEEFETDLNMQTEALLATVPELKPRVDGIVSNAWHAQSLEWSQNGWQLFQGAFHMALTQGQVSALRRAYLFLNHPEFDESVHEYELADALRDGVFMPDIDPAQRRQNFAVLAWMRKHHPDDFEYNPALHKFMLKPTSDLTASNP